MEIMTLVVLMSLLDALLLICFAEKANRQCGTTTAKLLLLLCF